MLRTPRRLRESDSIVAILPFVVSILALNPWLNFDPVNLPKLFAVTAVVLLLIVTHFKMIEKAFLKQRFAALTSVGLLAIIWIASFSNSESNIETQLLGIFWRNSGLISITLLVVLFLFAIAASNSIVCKLFMLSTNVLGLFNVLYGLFQALGLDNPDRSLASSFPIVGTFGNPNFFSAFLGIFLVCAVYQKSQWTFFDHSLYKLSITVVVCALIWMSDSVQGFFIILITISLFSPIFLFEKRNSDKAQRTGFFVVSTLAFSALSLLIYVGFMGRGIFAFFAQQSNFYRLEFLKVGIELFSEKLLLGGGVEYYRDSYRLRSEEAFVNLNADSPHNFLLELGVAYGGPAVLLYLILQFVASARVVNAIWRKPFDHVYMIICAMWFASQIASMINVYSLSTSVMQFILLGLVVGYSKSGAMPTSRPLKFSFFSIAWKIIHRAIVISIVSIFLFYVTFANVKDLRYREALEKNSPTLLREVSFAWPHLLFYLNNSSRIFLENGYSSDAKELAKRGLMVSPKNLYSLDLIDKASR